MTHFQQVLEQFHDEQRALKRAFADGCVVGGIVMFLAAWACAALAWWMIYGGQ